MADAGKRIFGPLAVNTGAAATKYTVPAATTTVWKMLHVSNPTNGNINLTISIGVDAAGTRIYDAFKIPGNSVFDPQPFWRVLAAGEVIQMFASAVGLVADGSGIEMS